jgi:hypothetical protein
MEYLMLTKYGRIILDPPPNMNGVLHQEKHTCPSNEKNKETIEPPREVGESSKQK